VIVFVIAQTEASEFSRWPLIYLVKLDVISEKLLFFSHIIRQRQTARRDSPGRSEGRVHQRTLIEIPLGKEQDGMGHCVRHLIQRGAGQGGIGATEGIASQVIAWVVLCPGRATIGRYLVANTDPEKFGLGLKLPLPFCPFTSEVLLHIEGLHKLQHPS
jgi:hypothetical protein